MLASEYMDLCPHVYIKTNSVVFLVASGSRRLMGDQSPSVCKVCKHWPLRSKLCSACQSANRLWSAATEKALPLESEGTVILALDSAFQQILAVRVAASKGVSSAPRLPGVEREKELPSLRRSRQRRRPQEDLQRRGKEKKSRPTETEEKKTVPNRREESRELKRRSRSEKRRQDKEKKRKRRKRSRSSTVSGSEVRRLKRETAISHSGKAEAEVDETPKRDKAERVGNLRPKPSQKARSPHTPPEPPPAPKPRVEQGKGWRGRIPRSSHPRWGSEVANKGITKRVKQEYHDRRGCRGRW